MGDATPVIVRGTPPAVHKMASGDTLLLPASVAGAAPLRVPHGTAPSAPIDGDIWITSAGLYVRINGATIGPLIASSTVTAAINAVVNAAPGALDTLDELAAALGDDANYAASVATALALKAPLTLVQGPAFGVYQSAAQALAASTWTKMQLQTEEFDTANCFDTSTYRFTPTMAGLYHFDGSVAVAAAPSSVQCGFYKNGFRIKQSGTDSGATQYSATASALISMNGTTDYVEFWGQFSVAQNTEALSVSTWFAGHLARPA
jgi:hypothetical protein